MLGTFFELCQLFLSPFTAVKENYTSPLWNSCYSLETFVQYFTFAHINTMQLQQNEYGL